MEGKFTRLVRRAKQAVVKRLWMQIRRDDLTHAIVSVDGFGPVFRTEILEVDAVGDRPITAFDCTFYVSDLVRQLGGPEGFSEADPFDPISPARIDVEVYHPWSPLFGIVAENVYADQVISVMDGTRQTIRFRITQRPPTVG